MSIVQPIIENGCVGVYNFAYEVVLIYENQETVTFTLNPPLVCVINRLNRCHEIFFFRENDLLKITNLVSAQSITTWMQKLFLVQCVNPYFRMLILYFLLGLRTYLYTFCLIVPLKYKSFCFTVIQHRIWCNTKKFNNYLDFVYNSVFFPKTICSVLISFLSIIMLLYNIKNYWHQFRCFFSIFQGVGGQLFYQLIGPLQPGWWWNYGPELQAGQSQLNSILKQKERKKSFPPQWKSFRIEVPNVITFNPIQG